MKKNLKGSMTIEASLIVPMILIILMELITLFFFYHDKNIMNGAAYETAVVGSSKMREKNSVTEEKLQDYCAERLRRKCILLTSPQIKVKIEESEIVVNITARKGEKAVNIEKHAAVTEPEKRIRDLRRLE